MMNLFSFNVQVYEVEERKSRRGRKKEPAAVGYGESGLQVGFQGNCKSDHDHQPRGLCDPEGKVWRWL